MPNDRIPSKKPPKQWWDANIGKIKAGLKRAHPDWDDAKIEEMARRTLGDTWANKMSTSKKKDTRAAEGKEYGSAPAQKSMLRGVSGLTGLRKAGEVYMHTYEQDLKNLPGVLIECHKIVGGEKNGKRVFDALEVHTPIMMLEDIEKYDDDSIWRMIEVLSANRWNDRQKSIQFILEFAGELKKRNDARVEASKKLAKDKNDVEAGPSNYEMKREFIYGKSMAVFLFPDEE